MKHIPKFDPAVASQMRVEEGMSWKAIGDKFGVDKDTIRRRIDPSYCDHRDKGIETARRLRASGFFDRNPRLEMSESARMDGERLLLEVPPDTRDLTARIAGDPIEQRSALWLKNNPGRSAWDRRQE